MNQTGRIAYLFGSDDQSGAVRAGTDLANRGSTDLWRLRGDAKGDFVRVHIPGNFRRIKQRPVLDGLATILNLVTDPDQNPIVLAEAEQFLKGFRGRVINRPGEVLKTGRAQVARLLDGIDQLLVPKVVRFRGHPNQARSTVETAGLRFPAILRETGTHSGRIRGIVANLDELVTRIDAKKTYFLTEFVEMRSGDELFHKIRVFFFGERAIVRHRVVSDHWNVHGPDRERVMIHHPDEIAIERRCVEEGIDAFPPGVRAALLEVRARFPLDYFGVDFAILPDGRALLFEANATMEYFSLNAEPPFDYFVAAHRDAEAKFQAMLTG